MLEARGYLADLPVPVGMSPLEWWKLFSAKYPNLWNLAQRYLTCPASSSSSERVFADAGNIVDDETASLSDIHVMMKVFLYHNWKQGVFPTETPLHGNQ